MRIAINAIVYHKNPRGVGRYLNNLLPTLANLDKKNQYFIFFAPWMFNNYDFLNIKQSNFHLVCLKKIPRSRIMRNLYQALIFPIKMIKFKVDVLHIPDTSPLFFTTCKTVSTIHDIAEYHFPEKYSRFQSIMRKFLVKHQCRRSHKIITISKYSMDDIITTLNIDMNKIHVVYNGIDKSKFRSKFVNQDTIYNENKYFLCVGEIEKSKNIPFLIKAYGNLSEDDKKNYKIILAGRKGNDFLQVSKEIKKEHLEENIIVLNYVTDSQLLELYNNCTCFIFPSLFEGFGLPILEAMACGTPVLSSNTSSLPEVCGTAAILFDPYDIRDLSRKMHILANDDMLLTHLKNEGLEKVNEFSWSKCAGETLKIYKSLK